MKCAGRLSGGSLLCSAEGFAGLQSVDLDSRDVLCEFAERVWSPREHRESSVVNWNHVERAEQADRKGSFAWVHRVVPPYREASHVRLVKFADDLHVAEHGRVTRVVEFQPAGKLHNEPGRFTDIDGSAVVFDTARVIRVNHGDFDV